MYMCSQLLHKLLDNLTTRISHCTKLCMYSLIANPAGLTNSYNHNYLVDTAWLCVHIITSHSFPCLNNSIFIYVPSNPIVSWLAIANISIS